MLLDTNAISAWAKGDAALLQALRPDRTWYLPSIALGEYRYGLLKSTRRAELEAWLESVEAACVVLAADGATARHYAELRRALDAGARGSAVSRHLDRCAGVATRRRGRES